mmetsp:Transcript_15671/g.23740  ORF Transcript_15671/g.23740 Transcript_15671/m.23740 type:complete len:422 (+) Transcript_15671:107-1372(+)
MGKKNKRKRNNSEDGKSPPNAASQKNNQNPLFAKQKEFLNTLTEEERDEFFSPRIAPDRRAELWMEQADLGEDLINRYSWATPNETAIRILKEFSPLVEIGCGANAYWCRLLRQHHGIDIVAYDVNVQSGGKINHKSNKGKSDNNGKKGARGSDETTFLREGGPDVLSSKEIQKSNRTLFLCYPDEEDVIEEAVNMDGSNDDDCGIELPLSMGAQCLEHYQGIHVIHVGELFLDANLSMDQAPWGRSSAPEFQQRLASEYHCLLKVQLPNWLHARDTISVWKRSGLTTIVFANGDDDDDSEEEEVEYRHIPVAEQLPINLSAPCLAHLLPDKEEKKDYTEPSRKTVMDDGNTLKDLEGTKGNPSEGDVMMLTPSQDQQQQQKKRSRSNKKKKKKRSSGKNTNERVKEGGNEKEDNEYVCPW